MSGLVTLTGKAGSGLTMTAKSFSEVGEVLIDMNKNMITLYRPGETVAPIDIGAATTVTATKAGNVWSLTIS